MKAIALMAGYPNTCEFVCSVFGDILYLIYFGLDIVKISEKFVFVLGFPGGYLWNLNEHDVSTAGSQVLDRIVLTVLSVVKWCIATTIVKCHVSDDFFFFACNSILSVFLAIPDVVSGFRGRYLG